MVRLAQLAAHALERLLQLAELVAAHDVERTGVVALADAVGAADQRGDGLLDLAAGAPAERNAPPSAPSSRKPAGDQQRRTQLVAARRRHALDEAGDRSSGRPGATHDAHFAERLAAWRRPGCSRPSRESRLDGLAPARGRSQRASRLPLVQHVAGGVAHRQGGQRAVFGERLHAPRERFGVAAAHERGGGIRRHGARWRLARACSSTSTRPVREAFARARPRLTRASTRCCQASRAMTTSVPSSTAAKAAPAYFSLRLTMFNSCAGARRCGSGDPV